MYVMQKIYFVFFIPATFEGGRLTTAAAAATRPLMVRGFAFWGLDIKIDHDVMLPQEDRKRSS